MRSRNHVAKLELLGHAAGIAPTQHFHYSLAGGLHLLEAATMHSSFASLVVVRFIFSSGFRRGTDIFKALARGADAACIGRPIQAKCFASGAR
jgi:isopentenyl diphosphate isomerase/L-lactate dehydrogenase-like FMN-dependent dehydrogenase